METNSLDSGTQISCDQTWWFKYYFSIPPCSYGRLSQSTGTCWCNVILNICLLTPAISTLLLQKFKECKPDYKKYIQDKYKDFNDICDCDDKLLNIIYGLINIILINKKKATSLDCNFVSEIAARIKGIGVHNDEFYYKTLDEKLLFGDNYDSLIGIYIFLKNIFIQNIDYVIIESHKLYSDFAIEYINMIDTIKNNSNISYSFKPAWNSWKNQDSAFYLKVTVSIYLQEKFLGSKFLWFYINATSNGIKAKCCEIPSIRFSLASRRFLASEFEKHSKKYCILPVTAYSGSQLSLAL